MIGLHPARSAPALALALALALWQIVLLGALLAWLQLSAATHVFEHVGASSAHHAHMPATAESCPLCVAFADSGNTLPYLVAANASLPPLVLALNTAAAVATGCAPARACRDPPTRLASR